MTYPATNFSEAVANTIKSGNQLHKSINGTANETVTTDSGEIPTLRKALVDNYYFKSPIVWDEGQNEETFNQLRIYSDGTWWYAPLATADNPIPMGVTPFGDLNWKLSNINNSGFRAPDQTGDGVKTTFNTPSVVKLPDNAFVVLLCGIEQRPTTDFVCNVGGTITFKDGSDDFIVPKDVDVTVMLRGGY